MNIDAFNDILIHWCWSNQQISLNFASLIITQMVDSKSISTYKPYLIVLESLLNLEDNIKMQRIEEILTTLMAYIQTNVANTSFALTCLKFLSRVAHENTIVKIWIHNNMEDVQVSTSYISKF